MIRRLLLLSMIWAGAAEAAKPNVVIIYGDDVFVLVGTPDATDAYMLRKHIGVSVVKPHFKSSVSAMRSVLPPNYRTGPRNMDVLEPTS